MAYSGMCSRTCSIHVRCWVNQVEMHTCMHAVYSDGGHIHIIIIYIYIYACMIVRGFDLDKSCDSMHNAMHIINYYGDWMFIS